MDSSNGYHESMPSIREDNEKEREVPLLSLKHPHCPGCKNSYLTAKGAGPPVKQLIMVAVVVLCNALPISSLYPFLYFMVQDFHIAKSSADIGYYAGAIGSVFMVGRVISSVPWGIFADKYGRRSVFFLGLLSIIVFQPIFGMTSSFWVALVTRLLLGTFNGMLGPLKAYSSEICNTENQAWGLTIVSTSWSIGLIIGPAMGGFLSRPAINYPGYFTDDSFFVRFPYILPSICQAVFAVFVLGVVYYLPETIHIHDEEDSKDVESVDDIDLAHSQQGSLWLNWPLMASVAVYCVWSLHDISFTEIFSMWCVSPEETGGLSWQTSDVGTILAISGFGMFIFQLTGFPPLANYLGPILVTRIPAMMAIPVVILFPFVTVLNVHLQWVVVISLTMLRNILSAVVVTGSFLLVNNSVPTEVRGACNGISLSSVSVFRAIGPAAGGAVFSWGQKRYNADFLPGSQMAFFILDVICVVGVFTMCPPFLPKQVNMPYKEWIESQQAESEHSENGAARISPEKL